MDGLSQAYSVIILVTTSSTFCDSSGNHRQIITLRMGSNLKYIHQMHSLYEPTDGLDQAYSVTILRDSVTILVIAILLVTTSTYRNIFK